MKRTVTLFLLCCLPAVLGRAQQLDSDRRARLDAKVAEYVAALKWKDAAVKSSECDFMISTTPDPAARQYITEKLYGHYLESRIMGDDAVAIHIADNWLLNGRVPMSDPTDLIYVRINADFNRSSLIGMTAPGLTLLDPAGQTASLFGGAAGDRYTVLYFYSADCPVCRTESARLKDLLGERGWPLDLVAVYTGQDAGEWARYRAEALDIHSPSARVRHYWDPEIDSDYQRKYGVIMTPVMMVIDPSGTIVGRGLDTDALTRLMKRLYAGPAYDYGGEAAMAMFDEVFPEKVYSGDILEVADYIALQTLSVGDTAGFKHLAGDMLYYLVSRRGESFKVGTEAFVDEYILSSPDVWSDRDDTLKVVGLAEMVKSLMAVSPIGSTVADLSVPGMLCQRRETTEGTYPLLYLRGNPTLVIFYAAGCPACEETLRRAGELVADKSNRGLKVLLIDMDRVMAADPALGQQLLDTFDLSALPFVMQLDYTGIIQRKYIDLAGGDY